MPLTRSMLVVALSAGAAHAQIHYTPLDVPGAVSTVVMGIDDAAEIVGSYYVGGRERGFIATTTPEPSTPILLGAGLAVVVAMSRRRVTRRAGT